jgi:hypothetical protein
MLIAQVQIPAISDGPTIVLAAHPDLAIPPPVAKVSYSAAAAHAIWEVNPKAEDALLVGVVIRI